MRKSFFAAAVLALPAFLLAQEPAQEAPKPTPEFRALFSDPPPEGAPDYGSWSAFTEYSQEFTVNSTENPSILEVQAEAVGICPETPCTFTLNVLLSSNKAEEDLTLVLRYVFVKDASRAEGYADAKPRTGQFRYFRRDGSTWARVEEGTERYTREDAFVGATWHYVMQKTLEQGQPQ